ncbi:restriction system protein [Flavobacterium resistens]|uniref:Restriction endonuclease n=1 Tax=Flavobacterium resistens TaxID=443612 RepID=A0A521BLT4_9FLAO|nr:restriction endonuclease [Flavobacterium resistens]MRX67501.1 restriction endonuclease [Flavobacterium resistens]SMO48045.1 restriction system protein [Flavobacterium resistens]
MTELFNYKFDDLFNPTLKALHHLGGSASVVEIENYVIELLKLSEEQISEIHRGTTTKLNYRLRWARNYLKNFGLLENSERGVWILTPKGLKTDEVDPKVVSRKVREVNKKRRKEKQPETESESDLELEPTELTTEASSDFEEENEITWKDELLQKIKGISPVSFERLCQRILRELGFQNVEVTGKPNDGGIDGKGILQLGGILSFHVVFQAKRYKETVSPSVIRDFRGSMSANVDKGLIITTGRFTREARKEAQRDGALPIDLIDGDSLAEKLKELRLGIQIELVEKVNVDMNWYDNI